MTANSTLAMKKEEKQWFWIFFYEKKGKFVQSVKWQRNMSKIFVFVRRSKSKRDSLGKQPLGSGGSQTQRDEARKQAP